MYIQSLNIIRKFLFKRMYRHNKVKILRNKAKIVVNDLFDILIENPTVMPKDWVFLKRKMKFKWVA